MKTKISNFSTHNNVEIKSNECTNHDTEVNYTVFLELAVMQFKSHE